MRCFAALSLVASLLLGSAHAENANVPAYFVLDESRGEEIDMPAWQRAAKAWKGEQFVRTYRRGGDDSSLQKAKDDAARAGASDNVVLLMTMTTADKDSREFRDSLAQLRRDPAFKDFSVLAEWPMCAIVQQGPGVYASGLRGTMVVVLDHPQANAFCYPMVQAYFATPPGPDGKRVAPIMMEPQTLVLQATLPPIEVIRKTLAYKAPFKQGKLVERPTTVYAPGEEIFAYVYLKNVGRKHVGTPMARFEIGLEVEVRDRDGEVLKSSSDLDAYKGDSPPPFPVSLDYFTNFATAGIAIDEPGDYTVAFIFHDRSREETPPATAEFDVTVE